MDKRSPIYMLKYVTLRALNAALSAAREHVVEIRTQLGVL